MKKIVLILLTGLMSCSIAVTNKVDDKTSKSISNIATIVNNTKVKEDCIPYKVEEKLDHSIYTQKASTKKENPYLGKIKMSINPSVMPWITNATPIEINNENKDKIKELEKEWKQINNDYCGIIINSQPNFYFGLGSFSFIFNNSCELDDFKAKYKNLTIFDYKPYKNDVYRPYSVTLDLSNETLNIDEIESLLHEYNKQFTLDIKEIDFSSIGSIKTFLIFIKLSTQNNISYKDINIDVFYEFSMPF